MKLLSAKTLFSLVLASVFVLTGCGGAETTIIEKESIPAEDEHDDDHDHDGGEPGGTALGRLLLVNPADNLAEVYDLQGGDMLASISLDATPSAVYATGGFRFAALIERSADKVSFIDGGLWQEAHDDHFDLFTTTPSLSATQLSGSRPTHFVPHEAQVALFLDGDTETASNAGVLVFDDHMIEENEAPVSLELAMPQHGVAEIRGDYLLLSERRDDAQSTSTNFILPDQVALYHLHEDEFELEQTFAETCPDLHGAAQNQTYVIFGCSDGVLLITDQGEGDFSAEKLANSAELAEGLRIGSIWAHEESEQFIAQASAHGGSDVQFFSIDPSEKHIDLIAWQPEADAVPLAQGFSFEAEQFLILDNQGFLTVLEPHEENGEVHWEYNGARLTISEADVNTLPEGMNFSMAVAQNAHTVYIADPIEQHVLTVDLELLEIVEEASIELDYSPAMITWLGIGEDEHEH